MRNLTLLAFLLLGACSGESEPTTPAESNAAATPVSSEFTPPSDTNSSLAAQPANNTADPKAVQAALQDSAIQSGNKPLIPAQQPQAKYEPKREPQFGFQPGGPILDEQLKDYYVEIAVEVDGKPVGVITAEMWPQFAPQAVRNYLRYADEGFYDGLTFHRVRRDFMVQGGDPKGDGSGDGPHGTILGEFNPNDERRHRYGVLSMARGPSANSASSQFFIVCGESPSTWGLDGKYASFGMMTSGVDALEAMASVPVGGPRRETPMRKIVMKSVTVKKGTAPTSEVPIERPAPDLNGEPAKVHSQHILVSYKGSPRAVPGVMRTKEEAEALVADLLKRAKDGEDFSALVKEYSDDNLDPADEVPGVYVLLNNGVQDLEYDRAYFALAQEAEALQKSLMAEIEAKTKTQQEAQSEYQSVMEPKVKALGKPSFPRDQMAGAFSDVSFSLGVGQIDVAEPDTERSPFGWHIIKRIK